MPTLWATAVGVAEITVTTLVTCDDVIILCDVIRYDVITVVHAQRVSDLVSASFSHTSLWGRNDNFIEFIHLEGIPTFALGEASVWEQRHLLQAIIGKRHFFTMCSGNQNNKHYS